MSASFTITNSINFCLPILKLQPVAVTGSEPAMTAANIVMETMLSPPFRWRFNRRSFSFACVVGQSDYTLNLGDFGSPETQWLIDPSGIVHQLSNKMSVAISGDRTRPTEMAIQFDDNLGNVTFRLKDVPDQIYTIRGDYQAKPIVIQSFGASWGNVSDEFGHIYNLGFLTLLSLLINDSRFPIFEKWWLGRLLASQDGISDAERDIFLGNWLNMSKTVTRSQASVNAGSAGRGQ